MTSDAAAKKKADKAAKKAAKLRQNNPNKPAPKEDRVNVLKVTKDGDMRVEKLLVKVREHNLISNSTLELKIGRRYGLVGANACGKSCLLTQINNGTIPIKDDWSKYYVFEEMKALDVNVLDAVMCCDVQEKRKLEELLTAEPNLKQEEYDDLRQQFEEKFGPTPQHRAGQILGGFGFNAYMQEKKVKEFSPSFRMRIALARAFYVEPDLLLLDLPTKNLDFETVDWLISRLSHFLGVLVVISNSESLLTEVCTDIIEIDINKSELIQHSDGYGVYLEQKNQGKLTEGEEGVASTMKKPAVEFDFGVISRTATGSEPPAIECQDVEFTDQNARLLFKGVNFSMTLTSKIGLVGSNRSGKSTFLDILADKALLSDGRLIPTRARILHFTQKSTSELDLTTTGEKYMETQTLKVVDPAPWRPAACSFGLTAQALKQRIENLSDGQRTRLILAGMAVQKPAILLLDEPATNLDIDAVTSLAEALKNWNGAFVIVSNNVELIKLACKQIWACVDKSVKWIEGGSDQKEKWTKTNGEETENYTVEDYKDEMIQRAADSRSLVRLKTTINEFPIFSIGSCEKVAWPFIRYEKYVDSFEELSKDDSIPLGTFKARAMVAHAPCQSVKEGYLEIPGEVSPSARYPVATEYAKRFCRTMLEPSWTLRTYYQKCLSKYTKENIYVTPDGAVKFKDVTIVEFSEEQFAANIDAAYVIINDQFSENGEKPPVDIQLLLDLMKNKKEKYEIFHIHASLVPLSNYGELYVRMYDCMMWKMPEHERNRILLKLPIEYLNNWTVDGNTGLTAENWTKDMQTNLVLTTHIKKKYLRAPPPVLTASEIEKHKLLVAQDFTGCLRHRKAHIMENFKGVCRYHTDGSNLATLVRYPKLTCILQEELHDAQELRDLMLHKLVN